MPLAKQDSVYSITVSQSPWTFGDSVFLSTVSVFNSGSLLFTHELISDSGAVIGDIQVQSYINDNAIVDFRERLAPVEGNPSTAQSEAGIMEYVKPDSWAVGFFNWLQQLCVVSWPFLLAGWRLS